MTRGEHVAARAEAFPAGVPGTVAAALNWAQARLTDRGIPGARREAIRLLAGVMSVEPPRVWLDRGQPLDAAARAELAARVARRRAGEPLQYIEGRADFRELTLRVDRSVLIPRPETEVLVGHVLDWAGGRGGLEALDVGTGSGAIALSLAFEGPFRRVLGVDISEAALKLAQTNAVEAGLGDRVEFRSGSFFEPVKAGERFDVVVSNPPYVAERERAGLPPEVRDHEPREALLAGDTGLEAIEAVLMGAPRHLNPGGLLALEIAPSQAPRVSAWVRGGGDYAGLRVENDYAGLPRIVLAERA